MWRTASGSSTVELFGDFHEPVPGILRRLSPTEPPYFSPIEEVAPQSWVKGRVVLIGDAAHATSPNMAQGAMAMEERAGPCRGSREWAAGTGVSGCLRGEACTEGPVGSGADASTRPHEESTTSHSRLRAPHRREADLQGEQPPSSEGAVATPDERGATHGRPTSRAAPAARSDVISIPSTRS
jgi:hypothetical protein